LLFCLFDLPPFEVRVKLFWEVTKLSFRRQLTYRTATVAGLLTNIFFGLMRAYVLIALYGKRDVVAGLTLQDIITYTGLTQAIIVYLSIFGSYDLMRAVHQGEIASDLLKPMHLFSFWLAQDLGRAIVGFLLRGLTIMIVYAIIFDITYPTTFVQWLALAISLVLSWLISFAYRFLVNLTAFWSPDARGIGRFAFIIVMFFSGFLMPLRFFPEGVQTIAYLTPFPHMLNTVVEVYLGVLTGMNLVWALLAQAAWVIGLVVICQFVLSRATRRLVILGG
jgi:ABC-2 type transport system permease protein